jgi:phage terminase large subunit-like protein
MRIRTIKVRLIKKFYLIVARGAAKSMFAALVHAYFMTVDTATTHQITTSPTMKQAEEVMSPIRTAITQSSGSSVSVPYRGIDAEYHR